jgi:hypothetical protein
MDKNKILNFIKKNIKETYKHCMSWCGCRLAPFSLHAFQEKGKHINRASPRVLGASKSQGKTCFTGAYYGNYHVLVLPGVEINFLVKIALQGVSYMEFSALQLSFLLNDLVLCSVLC